MSKKYYWTIKIEQKQLLRSINIILKKITVLINIFSIMFISCASVKTFRSETIRTQDLEVVNCVTINEIDEVTVFVDYDENNNNFILTGKIEGKEWNEIETKTPWKKFIITRCEPTNYFKRHSTNISIALLSVLASFKLTKEYSQIEQYNKILNFGSIVLLGGSIWLAIYDYFYSRRESEIVIDDGANYSVNTENVRKLIVNDELIKIKIGENYYDNIYVKNNKFEFQLRTQDYNRDDISIHLYNDSLKVITEYTSEALNYFNALAMNNKYNKNADNIPKINEYSTSHLFVKDIDVDEAKTIIKFIDLRTKKITQSIKGVYKCPENYAGHFYNGYCKADSVIYKGFFTKNGELIIDKRIRDIEEPDAELIPCFYKGWTDSGEYINYKWGFVDRNLTIKIKPKYKSAGKFRNNLAPVQNDNGKYGYIDGNGKIVIDFNYSFADEFDDSLAIVRVPKGYNLINKYGKYYFDKFYIKLGMINEGLSWCQTGMKKHGFIDKEGKLVIPDEYLVELTSDGKNTIITKFSNGLAPVTKDGEHWIYINKNNETVINSYFGSDYISRARNYSEGLAAVFFYKSHAWGFIDTKGKLVVLPRYNWVSDYVGGYALCSKSGYNYVIDKKGNIILSTE